MASIGDIRRESLGDAIYARIAKDLVRGRLRSGQKVTLRGLAEALGTGTTPVRDAVMRLLQDGALEQRTARDVRVPMPELAEYHEIVRIRTELEGLAAATAAKRATPGQLAVLRRLIERNEAAIARADWPAAVECNQRFHFALAEAAAMPTLLNILERLWLRMGPLLAGYYAVSGREMTMHHHAILAALIRGDARAARGGMARDIEDPAEGIGVHITWLANGRASGSIKPHQAEQI